LGDARHRRKIYNFVDRTVFAFSTWQQHLRAQVGATGLDQGLGRRNRIDYTGRPLEPQVNELSAQNMIVFSFFL
jgi:hypothetical protein